MTNAVDAIIDVAATVRLTRLVTEDELTRELRESALVGIDALAHSHPLLASKLEYLLDCPWCVSIYAGAALFALRRLNPTFASIVSGALAASLVAGVLRERVDI